MPNTSPRLNPTVLACIDGSNVTQSVCDYAAWYALKLNVPVTLLHVVQAPKSKRHDLSGTIGMNSRRQLLDELAKLDEMTARVALKHGEALIKDAKAHILNSPILNKAEAIETGTNKTDTNETTGNTVEVHTHQRHGTILDAIEHFAPQSELIVMGRRGEDHQKNSMSPLSKSDLNPEVNLGSQIETVVRAMHQPILICSDDFTPPDSYMLAYDGSPTADKAIQMICDSDLSQSSNGHLVMVGNADSSFENRLHKAQQKMNKAGLEIKVALLDNQTYGKDVVPALIKYRDEQDISMFIVGAYGHAKWRRFFVGSTTTKLLASTRVPILLLR